jgi:outer membrane lipoprotein-sorting protein
MKNIIIIALLCLGITTTTQAQKATSTPAAEKAFQQKFAGATAVKWEMEKKNDYEVNFTMKGKKGSANFSGTGEWLETEMAIPSAETPKAVSDAFAKAFSGATIKEVYKIETKEAKNYFEIEYTLKGKNKEAKIDPSGKIM